MPTSLLIGLTLLQVAPIASALSDGLELIYESDGVQQAPWVYDSVRVVESAGFERCVLVARRAQAARESCVRGDTLFERGSADARRPARPIGPNMQFAAASSSGNVLHYTTGDVGTRRIADGSDLYVIPTTIVTRDADGAVVRRLREDYAPALLSAVWGVFEDIDADGGWRSVREFSLDDVRRRAPP